MIVDCIYQWFSYHIISRNILYSNKQCSLCLGCYQPSPFTQVPFEDVHSYFLIFYISFDSLCTNVKHKIRELSWEKIKNPCDSVYTCHSLVFICPLKPEKYPMTPFRFKAFLMLCSYFWNLLKYNSHIL